MRRRKCTKCPNEGIEKDLFHRNGKYLGSGKPKYQSQCKVCQRERVKQYTQAARNGEGNKAIGLGVRASQNRVAGKCESVEAVYAEA